MLDVLSDLKSLVIRIKTLNTDNSVFRLHYRFTVTLLLAFSILVTSRQYIGDPIDCTIPSSNIREEVSSTISLPKAFDRQVGTEVIHPGVEKYVPGDDVVRHQYYQWVCFVLFIQAIMFYIPHYVWKAWECGRLKTLSSDIKEALVGDDVRTERVDALKSYFTVNLRRHNFYAWRYATCEVLNLANVVGQMYLTNWFLGGTFLTYGVEVIRFSEMDQMHRTDPMTRFFPRVTKCAFYTYGASGDPQKHDAVCVIPINIINEKIYIILWFWFILLAILSILAILYRILTSVSRPIRYYLLRARASCVPRPVIRAIASNVDYGDWFILYLLSKNINSYIFREVAEVVVELIEARRNIPEGSTLLRKHDNTL